MKNRIYKNCLFLLIGSIVLMRSSGNLNADVPVGTINIINTSLKNFNVKDSQGHILDKKNVFWPNNNNDATQFLKFISDNNGLVYATISDRGTLLRIFADANCQQWKASFKSIMPGAILNTIEWNIIEWVSNPNSKGSIDISQQAQQNYKSGSSQPGPVFAINVISQQGLIRVDRSTKDTFYFVYDIYMKGTPKTMTVDKSNIDISKYYYTSDGVQFRAFDNLFTGNKCQDGNGYGCDKCSITKGFKIDDVSIDLPAINAITFTPFPALIRIHVG